jgi:hypothetical protein
MERLAECPSCFVVAELGPEQREQRVARVLSARTREREIGEKSERLWLSRQNAESGRLTAHQLQSTERPKLHHGETALGDATRLGPAREIGRRYRHP